MKITHGPSPAPTKMWSVPGGQWTKSQASQRPLLALDQQHALAGEDEEVLLVGLAVVHAARLAGLEHGDRVADLRERASSPSKMHAAPKRLVRHPRRLADVDHEPARR